jgi:hypothetical protein
MSQKSGSRQNTFLPTTERQTQDKNPGSRNNHFKREPDSSSRQIAIFVVSVSLADGKKPFSHIKNTFVAFSCNFLSSIP